MSEVHYRMADVPIAHRNEADKEIRQLVRGGLLVEVRLTCNCGQCGRMHNSDCAVHNEPALPREKCDCE